MKRITSPLHRHRVVFAVWGILGLISAPARADTIIVRADGSGDYPTIQAAMDAASDGDEIVLEPGTYTGDGSIVGWRGPLTDKGSHKGLKNPRLQSPTGEHRRKKPVKDRELGPTLIVTGT